MNVLNGMFRKGRFERVTKRVVRNQYSDTAVLEGAGRGDDYSRAGSGGLHAQQ